MKKNRNCIFIFGALTIAGWNYQRFLKYILVYVTMDRYAESNDTLQWLTKYVVISTRRLIGLRRQSCVLSVAYEFPLL
jgi:hypothetical protein